MELLKYFVYDCLFVHKPSKVIISNKSFAVSTFFTNFASAFT
ncbi:hypothetical protein HMPREF3226_01771 [Prevotella corporis]|uniref:Uncharacterized protein n=1 Tax=Prevotella corporis TaxID=28128 RepID=A0A133Q2R7_9BACT|nr:hypothetical protein HMPREF3226_01771 [Prevotella corporis]